MGSSDLKSFADTELLWMDIVALSKTICHKKIAGWVSGTQGDEDHPRDLLEESQCYSREMACGTPCWHMQ